MLSYSPPASGRPGTSRMPSELVGVAGFEPAASSSRSQVSDHSGSRILPLTSSSLSAAVHWCVVPAVGIVTQLVTRSAQ
jgi:hypothetical protein